MRSDPGGAYLGYQSSSINILVLGFDGLQKPVAFWIGEVQANATINDYPCAVTLALTDLAEMLESHLSA